MCRIRSKEQQKEMHKEYEEFTRNKQIKNDFAIATPEHEIVDIVNHTLRLLRDTVYEKSFDQERKEAAMFDLMRVGEILKEIKKGNIDGNS